MILAVLMVLSSVPLSVFAAQEPNTGTKDPIKIVINQENETQPAKNAECTHGEQCWFNLTECICSEKHESFKGTGMLCFCALCGKYLYVSSWGGGSTFDDFGSARLDVEKQIVILDCTVSSCNTHKEFPLNPGTHVHSYVIKTVIPATCKDEGSTIYQCSECGEEKSEIIPKGNKHLFDYDSPVITPAACEHEGYSSFICRICGFELRGNYMPALGHDWDKGVITTEPNCNTVGEKTFTCQRCGETKTTELGIADSHNFIEIGRKEKTCTEDGYVEYKCSRCGETHKEVFSAEHLWEQTSETLPTCVKSGAAVYTCKVCGETTTSVIPATGEHIWKELDNTATCTENGFIHYKCEVCGEKKAIDSSATGHHYSEWTVTTPATCETAGTETKTCFGCGDTQTRTLPRLSHNYDASHKCVWCHKTYPEVQRIVDAIDALPVPANINETNARAIYNRIIAIQSEIDAVKTGTDANNKAALQLYADLDKLNDDLIEGTTGDVYTTTANPATVNGTAYTWYGLPVNLDGKAIEYRVTESEVDGYKTAVYDAEKVILVKSGDSFAAETGITNELETRELEIRKTWEDVNYSDPASAGFLVEYRHGNSGWLKVEEIEVLIGETGKIEGLPVRDSEGNKYEYRVSESYIKLNDGSAS